MPDHDNGCVGRVRRKFELRQPSIDQCFLNRYRRTNGISHTPFETIVQAVDTCELKLAVEDVLFFERPLKGFAVTSVRLGKQNSPPAKIIQFDFFLPGEGVARSGYEDEPFLF